MNGIVKKVGDFLGNSEWLFIIEDNKGAEYFVLTELFYKKYGIKSPVTKRELDSLDEKMKVSFSFKLIDGRSVVTSLLW